VGLSFTQPFLVLSPAGLMTIFYCLRFETPPTWRARTSCLHSPGTGWLHYIPRHWFPFRLPPTTRRAMVEVFKPASRETPKTLSCWSLLYSLSTDHIENTDSKGSYIVVCIHCHGNMFTEPLPSNVRLLCSTILAFKPHVTI
jgi:hypothetical protein